MSYLYLFGAIVFEVTGTLLLPISNNFTKILPSTGLTVCYLISFYFLTFAIKTIPIAIVYATWAGLGIFLIALSLATLRAGRRAFPLIIRFTGGLSVMTGLFWIHRTSAQII